MLSKSDWRDIAKRVIAGTITTIIVVPLIRWAWSNLPSVYHPYILLGGVLVIALIWALVLTFRRVKDAIKFRPSLAITVKDISCYVMPYRESSPDRSIPTKRGFAWHPECAIQITNKRAVPITDVTGTMKLVLGKENFITHLSFDRVEGHKSRRFLAVFPSSHIIFPLKDPRPDLNAPYHLQYTYSFTIHDTKTARQLKAKTSGNLTKADWIGDADQLNRFRRLGFA